jgi:hypothetical protein
MTDDEKKVRIAALNDELRMGRSPRNGKVIVTGDLAAEQPDPEKLKAIVVALHQFNAFTEDNDPHGEHDCAKFAVGDEEFMFKIDYYALDEEHLSDHPEDPNVTIRVMSVFYAHDY